MIRYKTCQDIMSDCAKHFDYLVRFIFRTTEFYSDLYNIAVVNKYVQLSGTRNTIQKIHEGFQYLVKLELLQNFSTYSSTNKPLEKLNATISICEKMTDLARDPLIVKILPSLESINNMSREQMSQSLGWVTSGVYYKITQKRGVQPEVFWNKLSSIVDPEDLEKAKKTANYTSPPTPQQTQTWTIQNSARILTSRLLFSSLDATDYQNIFTGDVKVVEQSLQDEGYVYAKVVEVRRTPVNEDYMDLHYVINEGASYNVGTVTIEGATVFTPEELTKALKTVAGFAYAGSDVRDDEQMIGDYYGSRGYADARVETSIIPAGTGLVNVNYRITEGTKSVIRKLNISGNEVTQDQVVRREMPIAPGDELNTVKMEAGKSRLKNLGYFSEVDVRANPTEQPGFKDVDVNVTEQSTGSVNFGAGFSSIDSLVGFIDLTQTNFDIGGWPNFRGAGQRFHLGLRYGTRRRDFSLALTEPWFMGQKLSFTTELFYRDLFYLSDYFDQQNLGGSLAWRKPLGEHSYLELTYTAQNVKIHNIASNASDLIRQEEGKFFQSKIDLSWVHDTRDSVYITRTGHKVELGGMYSGLGGDVKVHGLNATASQYFLLPWDTIFSVEGSFRTVDASSGQVPIFERLFLGGANNLRGFQFREVGPKDAQGEPIGGLTSAYASFEYTFPIVEKVRGAVFYDVGMVSGDSYDWGGDINSNVGVGLRLFLPIGPIRVDFGVPVQADEFNDSGGQFQFNVGYKF